MEGAKPIPMKIEFRCNQCDRLLRVAAGHAGCSISCPACSSELLVPEPWSVADSDVTEIHQTVWNPQTVSFREILQQTWTLYVENLWLLLAVAFFDLILWIIGFVLILVPAMGTFAVLWKAIGMSEGLSFLGMLIVLVLGIVTLVNVMFCRHVQFFLRVARGEPTNIFDAFHIGRGRGSVSMLPTIFGLIAGTGLMLCVFPGVFVYLRFWPYLWVWSDRQTGGRDRHAFARAHELSSKNLGTSVAIGAAVVGELLFGLTLFGPSFVGLLKAVAYLRMSGQEVAGRPRHDHDWDFHDEGIEPA